MNLDLKSWQGNRLRNKMADYRRAQGDYYLQGRPTMDIGNGHQAFSLISPPLGSRIARRRIRLILDSMSARQTPADQGSSSTLMGRVPHVITVAVTYKCQCDCLHCSAANLQKEVQQMQSALSFDELRDAIHQAVDMGSTCVVLTGGEPLLYERIYDLIGTVEKSRSVCTIFTNGEYLTEGTIEQLKQAGVFGVYVSLDHPEPILHDKNRGRPGLYLKAVQGLKRCQQADIPTGISTYATKENLRNGELDALMEVAKSLQVLEVFIFDVIPTGRLSQQRECMLDDGEADTLKSFREKYKGKSGYPGIIHQTMFSSIAFPCVAEGCPAGMVTAHLRANGDVSPCDFTPHSFGNIRQRSLKDIWRTMTAHHLYAEPSPRCRLSQQEFWAKLDELRFGA